MSHADLVVKNANVYTVDSTNPRAEALAVKDGKIVKVGKESDVVSLIGPSTEVDFRRIGGIEKQRRVTD